MEVQAKLRIGTRGSHLALAQAEEVKARLIAAHPELAAKPPEVVVIRTSGDRIRDRPLREAGGKGLFTKEIEEALIAGAIDLAVHSMKDMPTVLPDGLVIACILEREDPRDALIAGTATSLAELPAGAVVGTSSLRRRAQLLRRRPDLNIVEFRGNVDTRLRKLAAGEAEATLLAMAGLKRLGRTELATAPLLPEELLPALAQGAIGVETRADDDSGRERLTAIAHAPSARCVAVERAFLAALDGSCRTPIAGLAGFCEDGRIAFRGEILSPDGKQAFETALSGPPTEAEKMGRAAGEELLARAGPAFLADMR